jgi:hypothetical protein
MTDQPQRIPDEDARDLWERAIELQASAESSAVRLPSAVRERGLSLDQVVAAAKGAGIDPTFVRMAVAERRLPDADEVRRDRRTARWARSLLAGVEAIEVGGVVPAPPERAVAAFDAVVARPSFQMVLEDRVGPDPPLEGVLVYRIHGHAGTTSSFHPAMAVADVRVMMVTAEAEGDGTIVRLRLPQFEHGTNLVLWGGITGGSGVAGGFGGAAAGAALGSVVGTASTLLVAGTAGAGALAAGATALAGSRAIAAWGRRKGVHELQRLLRTVAIEAASRK